jgi:chromosome segregation protein
MTYITRLTLQGFKSFNKKVSIPFVNGLNIICGPNGSGKSLWYNDEVILTNGEIKPIGEIVEERLKNARIIQKLEDGILTFENPENLKVLGLDLKTMKIKEKTIAAFIKRKGEKKLYKIRTRSGKEIVTTGCHPVMILRNGKIIPESVDRLKKGDLIATPSTIKLENRCLDIESKLEISRLINARFARFIGYLIGDGYITTNRLEFVNENEEMIQDMVRLAKELNLNPKIRQEGNLKRVIIYSTSFSKLLHGVFNLEKILSATKVIPPLFLFAKENVVSNLLAALVDCDGYIRKDVAGIEYSTKSERLAKQVQFLLLRFGITSIIKTKMKRASNSKHKKEKYYFVYIYGIENLRKFYRKVPLISKDKIERIKFHLRKKIKSQRNIEDILPKDVNQIVKQIVKLLGLEIKKLRKRYPTLSAYVENRCYPTRDGIRNIISLFKKRADEIGKIKGNLKLEQNSLLKALNHLKITRKEASEAIGLHPDSITNSWVWNKFKARPKNLRKLYEFIRKEISKRLEKSKGLIKILERLSSSDIFWDRIVKIEKVPGEKWVYDLSIPDCHNFIANGIFVHNSNLVDSICFVLGRISAKSMRADRLTELIFHGSEKKKPADYASVTLYLDNSKKEFPYDEEEISITRKINRSGASIYKINGKTVTREKVLQLLSAARIKPDGHNIILQGDVTNIVEMNPVERREIIDEISGIAEYNDKKEKAMRDLESVEQRLKEAEIIISQRYEIFKKLQAERDAALRYQKLQKDLKILKASYLNKLIQIKSEKHSKLEEKVQSLKEKYEKTKNEIEKIEKELEEKENSTREIVRKLIEISKSVKIEKEVSELRSNILIKREKIESNLREIERIDSLIEKLESIERKKAELKGEIPNAVKAILNLNLRGVYGTIENLISVPPEYKIAIEVAAGPHLFDLVVENDEIAEFCINYLKREKIGRATFLPLNKIKPSAFKDFSLLQEPGIIGVASKFIKYDPKFMRAIEFVFGNTLLAKDLESARRLIGRARVVTLEGELIERSGAIVGGYYFKSPEKIETEKEIENYRAMKKRLSEEVEILKEELKQLEEKLEKIKVEETAKKLIDLEKLKISSEKEIDELREKRRKLQNKLVNLEIEINQIKIEQAKIETELESLRKEISQYDVTHYVDEKLSDLSNFIKKAEKELQDLGPVNLRAIEEYEKFKSEFESYKEKYEKILEEKKAVLKMIEEIEEKKKEVFYKCLNEISKHFNSIFLKMFKGTASLELEDPNNLESGLLIKANPGGKKVLNIDSMSGGEKSLTALAFLFAIQKYRPAPFYVLDEVDAALDKENVAKLGELLRSFSKNEQFIIVTHNDQTVRYGDRVYGVTMSEGESKILGLELPK